MYLNIDIILRYNQAGSGSGSTILICSHSHSVFVNIATHAMAKSHVQCSQLWGKFYIGVQTLKSQPTVYELSIANVGQEVALIISFTVYPKLCWVGELPTLTSYYTHLLASVYGRSVKFCGVCELCGKLRRLPQQQTFCYSKRIIFRIFPGIFHRSTI